MTDREIQTKNSRLTLDALAAWADPSTIPAMTRYRFYVGECDREGHLVSNDQWAAIERELVQSAGGFTVISARGAWDDAGTMKCEASRIYEVLADYTLRDDGAHHARIIKALARQKLVLYTSETVRGEFV